MLKKTYLALAALCLLLLSFALWLQHIGWGGELYAPCPLCVLQRLSYLGVAIACVGACFSKVWQRLFGAIAVIFSMFGLGVVVRHICVIYNPTVSCGLDPLEVWINQWTVVRWFDWFFKADGLCSAPLPPVLGLSVPFWSLIWLSLLTVTLLLELIFQKRLVRLESR